MRIVILFCFLVLACQACTVEVEHESEAVQKATPENSMTANNAIVVDANVSVQHLQEAVEALEKGDKKMAAYHLQIGIDALANEGLQETGSKKEALNKAIQKLMDIKEKLAKGEAVQIDDLLNAKSEGEALVPHKIIVGDDEVTKKPQ